MRLFEGPDLGHSTGEGMQEKIGGGKSPAPGGIRTHDLLIMWRVLYRCATTATPEPKISVKIKTNWDEFAATSTARPPSSA